MKSQTITGAADESLEDVEELLANRECRYLLACLYLYANPMRLPDVAEQIALWNGANSDDTLQERLRIYDTLYHDHLPVLREAGLVTYEQTADMIERGPTADQYKTAVLERLVSDFDELLAAEQRTFETDDETSGTGDEAV